MLLYSFAAFVELNGKEKNLGLKSECMVGRYNRSKVIAVGVV